MLLTMDNGVHNRKSWPGDLTPMKPICESVKGGGAQVSGQRTQSYGAWSC
jgi:hypothetical protein